MAALHMTMVPPMYYRGTSPAGIVSYRHYYIIIYYPVFVYMYYYVYDRTFFRRYHDLIVNRLKSFIIRVSAAPPNSHSYIL